MKNQWQTIWVTLISIFAMLMSAYASSSPEMTFHLMETSHSVTEQQELTDCHSMSSGMHHSTEQASDVDEHCNSGSGVHMCCTAACSSVHFPLTPTSELASTESSLAPYTHLTIGQKVVRQQTLLRPPSA